jgi:predicted alpha/beta-hydrolase family hydrolase
LTHGAGSDRDQSTLVAIEERLEPFPVRRMNFPYRERGGKRPPDRAPVLLAALSEQLDSFAVELGTDPSKVVLGGRSMGGRMCSMLAAEPDRVVAGLVLVSYPLHAPGKPDRLRTEHLPQVDVPTLFISGDRDPFGTPEELAAAQLLLAGPSELVVIPGGRHDIKGGDEQVAELVAQFVSSLSR